ncbi:hypothetical protein Hanom_Chr00s003338g01711991 [Helianthus anomalus]
MLIVDTRLQHSLEPLDSTDQTDDLNGEDWQEEVYRKVLYNISYITFKAHDITNCI